jgi:NADPH:quinone reductase-like Zn-dependent oxidoreductase
MADKRALLSRLGEGEVVVHVLAASLKPIDRQLASASHHASPRQLPIIRGSDGVGRLDDGRRVFFGGCRNRARGSNPTQVAVGVSARVDLSKNFRLE